MCILVFPTSYTSYSTLWTGPRRGWGAAGARPRRPQRQWNCDSTFPRFSRCTGTSVNGQNDRRRCGLSIHHRIVPQLVRNAEICQGYSLGRLPDPEICQGYSLCRLPDLDVSYRTLLNRTRRGMDQHPKGHSNREGTLGQLRWTPSKQLFFCMQKQ